MKRILTIAALVALAAQPAFAGNAYNVCFYSMDGNGDGTVTLDEFSASIADADKAVFHAADADGDGSLVHDEWEAYKQAQGFEDHHG